MPCPRLAALGPMWLGVVLGCHDAGIDPTVDTDTDASIRSSSSALGDEASASDRGDLDGSESTGTTGGEDDTSTGDPIDPPVSAPEIYPPGRTHSPVTPWVADRWREIAADRADRFEDVFMKAGASSTVNTNTLHCFADDAGDAVDLGAHVHLDPTLQFFRGGDAAGSTPFDRVTLAAEVGRSASWVIEGDPSPLQAELDLLSPRLALVHFGANDMGVGATYDAALQQYHLAMSTLLDTLESQGVIPVLFGITRRGDNVSADRWVSTWNAAIRGLAQARQTPFVDLHHAIDPLPGHGLGPDGLHLEAYAEGACILDDAGLEHGYNVRNLVALEALDRTVAILVDDAVALDDPAPPRAGVGTVDDPIVIEPEALPFVDAQDTSAIGAADIDAYGCAASDESGPEVWYRIELAQARRLRLVVLDREGIDVDLHVLDEAGDPSSGCIARDDRILELTLQAGTWHVVVDTWSDGGATLAGEYLLLIVECDADDTACG